MTRSLLLFALSATLLIQCKTTRQESGSGEMTGDNSKTSLDWQGVYRGVLPCEDCSGLQTEIRLLPGDTYEMSYQYLGKNEDVVRSKGSLMWNNQGSIITLVNVGEPNRYLVGENVLIKLDLQGNRIGGDLAEKYKLKKDLNTITEKYWKLVELNGQKVVRKEDQTREPHFILKDSGNQVNGNGGCNSFHGTYELLPGNRIRFSKMASTMMACDDMAVEDQFLKVLETADNYNILGDTLQLNKARMAPLARFEAVYFK
jgi:heat shock protein HslJ